MIIEAEKLVGFTTALENHKERIQGLMIGYALSCYQRAGMVLPRFAGVVYDFEQSGYRDYIIDNLLVDTETQLQQTFFKLCGTVYKVGFRTIYASFIMPINVRLKDVDEDDERQNEKCALLFSQTELHTKYAVYQYKNGKMVMNSEYSKRLIVNPRVMSMGYVIGFAPNTN